MSFVKNTTPTQDFSEIKNSERLDDLLHFLKYLHPRIKQTPQGNLLSQVYLQTLSERLNEYFGGSDV